MKLAVLSPNGTLMGFEEVDNPPDLLPSNRVAVPDGCDLVPGKYRWAQAAHGMCFMPIDPATNAVMHGPPSMELASYHSGRAIQRAGIKLPRATVLWLDWYRDTYKPKEDDE